MEIVGETFPTGKTIDIFSSFVSGEEGPRERSPGSEDDLFDPPRPGEDILGSEAGEQVGDTVSDNVTEESTAPSLPKKQSRAEH
ncbi:hypothetical protein [Eastern grey kangaroopox virus]|uniref:Uncharacterized protein n=1 Tax=Eastern grey kangaroopox virus TaxID=2042482 RepID=A0A2C9DT97_9POXV|nr:hypothetical protein KM541_gp134 [Eastern grey kangaroopox virus]ATI21230.1 hypothetical protein [Eastern grey kangaroopox virus]ATX75138.1 hypothetical protein EKPV-NSW-ORF150 [Eastern grey kangaroopox virus]